MKYVKNASTCKKTELRSEIIEFLHYVNSRLNSEEVLKFVFELNLICFSSFQIVACKIKFI